MSLYSSRYRERHRLRALDSTADLLAANVNLETTAWVAAITSAGSSVSAGSIAIADVLVTQIKAATFANKIKWLLPLLGNGIIAARVPLIDVLGAGIVTNTGFVNADFAEATGLQGNGSSKYLDLLIKPSQLGASDSGGLGYWENNVSYAGTGVEPIGTYNTANTARYVLDLRTNLRAFRWGAPANSASQATAAGNGHFYGQRNGATSRAVYLNGSSVGTNTTSDAAAGASDRNIWLMGCFAAGNTYWAGRCAVSYLTDGTLTGTEISDLHALLNTYLITPTGR